MTSERLLALSAIAEKIRYSDNCLPQGHDYLRSVEAIILANDIWEGRAKPEEWVMKFGNNIKLVD